MPQNFDSNYWLQIQKHQIFSSKTQPASHLLQFRAAAIKTRLADEVSRSQPPFFTSQLSIVGLGGSGLYLQVYNYKYNRIILIQEFKYHAHTVQEINLRILNSKYDTNIIDSYETN